MKQEFKKIIEQGKHIIKIISSNGYEAYFTGETVRNILLDLDVIDVEISTNAPLENVERILSDFESARADDNILAIRGDDVVFMIRRFQSEYRKKKNEKAIFSDGDDIISDLKTRIFSIDSMAINLNGKITDICDGYRDINRKKIRIFGNVKGKLIDNPLIALEAIALVSELDFSLDYRSFISIKRCRQFRNISLEEMLPYIDRIISGKHFKQAVFYLNKTKLSKYIPIIGIEFKALGKKFQKIDHDMIIAKALVRNGEIDDDVLNMCKKPQDIKAAIDLAIVTPKSQYDSILLFNYGVKNAVLANQINTLLGRALKKTRKIEKEYESLPIKKVCDMKYKGDDILKQYPDIDNEKLVDIVEEMKYKILMKELPNDYNELRNFVINKIEKPIVIEESKDAKPSVEEFTFENEFGTNSSVLTKETVDSKNTDDDKLAVIEKRMEEYEKRLLEKDEKINALEKNNLRAQLNNDIDIFMQKHYEALDKINVYGMTKERISREIRNAYEDILIDNLEKYKKLRDDNNE